jgi:peroxiredoxin
VSGLEIGGPAPDFTLRDQFGADVTLSDFHGKKAVAIFFFPFAFSGVCTGEMSGLRDRLDEFVTFDTEVLAIFNERTGAPRRSSYIIDKAGVVRWAVHNDNADGRDLDEHLRQLHAAV